MFDHVQIKVADLEASRAFYAAIFHALGYGVVFQATLVVGFGVSPHCMFEVRQADETAPLSRAVHVAFSAKTADAVRAFHAAALAHGGADNGAPGLRPEYEEGYYAAFVVDPDGHNLEAVFSGVGEP
jgi:catechol 2,3-dioxygenase-like lactoylglutathione lyase family enzyme